MSLLIQIETNFMIQYLQIYYIILIGFVKDLEEWLLEQLRQKVVPSFVGCSYIQLSEKNVRNGGIHGLE